MALGSSSKGIHVRTVTFLGSGVVLLALIGYLYLQSGKSDRKKSKKKSQKSNSTTGSATKIELPPSLPATARAIIVKDNNNHLDSIEINSNNLNLINGEQTNMIKKLIDDDYKTIDYGEISYIDADSNQNSIMHEQFEQNNQINKDERSKEEVIEAMSQEIKKLREYIDSTAQAQAQKAHKDALAVVAKAAVASSQAESSSFVRPAIVTEFDSLLDSFNSFSIQHSLNNNPSNDSILRAPASYTIKDNVNLKEDVNNLISEEEVEEVEEVEEEEEKIIIENKVSKLDLSLLEHHNQEKNEALVIDKEEQIDQQDNEQKIQQEQQQNHQQKQLQLNETDKTSDTSSDSGHGPSEMFFVSRDNDLEELSENYLVEDGHTGSTNISKSIVLNYINNSIYKKETIVNCKINEENEELEETSDKNSSDDEKLLNQQHHLKVQSVSNNSYEIEVESYDEKHDNQESPQSYESNQPELRLFKIEESDLNLETQSSEEDLYQIESQTLIKMSNLKENQLLELQLQNNAQNEVVHHDELINKESETVELNLKTEIETDLLEAEETLDLSSQQVIDNKIKEMQDNIDETAENQKKNNENEQNYLKDNLNIPSLELEKNDEYPQSFEKVKATEKCDQSKQTELRLDEIDESSTETKLEQSSVNQNESLASIETPNLKENQILEFNLQDNAQDDVVKNDKLFQSFETEQTTDTCEQLEQPKLQFQDNAQEEEVNNDKLFQSFETEQSEQPELNLKDNVQDDEVSNDKLFQSFETEQTTDKCEQSEQPELKLFTVENPNLNSVSLNKEDSSTAISQETYQNKIQEIIILPDENKILPLDLNENKFINLNLLNEQEELLDSSLILKKNEQNENKKTKENDDYEKKINESHYDLIMPLNKQEIKQLEASADHLITESFDVQKKLEKKEPELSNNDLKSSSNDELELKKEKDTTNYNCNHNLQLYSSVLKSNIIAEDSGTKSLINNGTEDELINRIKLLSEESDLQDTVEAISKSSSILSPVSATNNTKKKNKKTATNVLSLDSSFAGKSSNLKSNVSNKKNSNTTPTKQNSAPIKNSNAEKAAEKTTEKTAIKSNIINKSNQPSAQKSKEKLPKQKTGLATSESVGVVEPLSSESFGKSTTSDDQYQDLVVYEFNFPRLYCGKLIGKNGVHVDNIRSKTQTQIAVRNDPNVEEQQIVCVSGRLEDVDRALEIIGNRFPAKQFPQISFKPISKPIVYRRYNPDKALNADENSLSNLSSKVFIANNMYVDLVSLALSKDTTQIMPVDVNVTAVVSAAHVFIQLPTNPTFQHLEKLDEEMLESYGKISDEEPIPLLLEPIEYGTICVAPTSYGWHRAMVTSYQSLEETTNLIGDDYKETCGLATVKFLDYGGYLTIPCNQLRQLRSDFMLLPFQALECYLEGIYPYEGTEEEGKIFLSQLFNNSQLQATVTGYAEDNNALINLNMSNELQKDCNVNQELVKCGFAFFLESDYDENTSYYNQQQDISDKLEMDI